MAADGASSRWWLKLQRVLGNRQLVVSARRTVRSAGGGKPCITASAAGSVSRAVGAGWAESAIEASWMGATLGTRFQPGGNVEFRWRNALAEMTRASILSAASGS